MGLTAGPSPGGMCPRQTIPPTGWLVPFSTGKPWKVKPTDWAVMVKGPTLNLVVASKAGHRALRGAHTRPGCGAAKVCRAAPQSAWERCCRRSPQERNAALQCSSTACGCALPHVRRAARALETLLDLLRPAQRMGRPGQRLQGFNAGCAFPAPEVWQAREHQQAQPICRLHQRSRCLLIHVCGASAEICQLVLNRTRTECLRERVKSQCDMPRPRRWHCGHPTPAQRKSMSAHCNWVIWTERSEPCLQSQGSAQQCRSVQRG